MSTREDRIPTGIGESGSLIEEYFPTADARAAGHRIGPPGLHTVALEDAEPRTGTREELNVATHDQRLLGLVAQMEGDLATHRLAPDAVRYVLEERLCETGIGCDAAELDRLTELILTERAPTDIEHAEPGASRRL